MSNARPPDLLFIVLDCVSSRDFYGGEDAVGGLTASREIADQGIRYSRAVAPASWSPPSHASMFTGIGPWESGAHGPVLGQNYSVGPTLAEDLRAAGFRTGSFSANPYICPESGLTRGFDSSLWGSFSDCFLRKLTRWTSPPHRSELTVRSRNLIDKLPRATRKQFAGLVYEFPILADVTTRVVATVLNGRRGSKSLVAPWIEHYVREWLETTPPSRPVFGFVNLLDAHEPYVGLPENVDDVLSWLRTLSVSQRSRDRVEEPISKSLKALEALRNLYRASIRILDGRLKSLFQIFQELRDWDNVCVVVTGDHGQTFEQPGRLFHAHGIADSIHRVPLIIKRPGGDGAGTEDMTWTSLTKLPSIIAELAHMPEAVAKAPKAVLGANHEWEREVPFALSLADVADTAGHRSEGYRTEADGDGGASIVGYSDEFKLVVDVRTLSCRAFSISNPGGALREISAGDAGIPPILQTAAIAAATKLRNSSLPPNSDAVDLRLRQWGYD